MSDDSSNATTIPDSKMNKNESKVTTLFSGKQTAASWDDFEEETDKKPVTKASAPTKSSKTTFGIKPSNLGTFSETHGKPPTPDKIVSQFLFKLTYFLHAKKLINTLKKGS